MTKEVNKNTAYEVFVQEIHKQLLRAEGLENIEVKHDIKLLGNSGQSHQIDVYWEYKYAGIIHKVALECENYSSAITMSRLRDFHSVLIDIPDLQGIMVTRTGYQSGVIKYANAYKIGLRVVRGVNDSDYNGRIRNISLDITMLLKDIDATKILLDGTWAIENLTVDQQNEILNNGLEGLLGKDFVVRGSGTESEITFDDLYNKLPMSGLAQGVVHSHKYDFEDSLLHSSFCIPVKMVSVEFFYRIRASKFLTAEATSTAKSIIQDVINGHLLFIDEDGAISGDTNKF